MFARAIGSALRVGIIAGTKCNSTLKPILLNNIKLNNTSLVSQFNASINNPRCLSTLMSTSLVNEQPSLFKNNNYLTNLSVNNLAGNVPVRTLTKYSRTRGKRSVVKTVLKRFYRLNWGIWIRTKTGRHKRLWTKRGSCRRRLKMHVFTNSTQSWMLDKMVSSYWRAPKYWVDDPYNPYHQREEYWVTRKAPQP